MIVGAEYITGLVALNTHNWDLFITSDELASKIRKHNFEILKIQGADYNLLC